MSKWWKRRLITFQPVIKSCHIVMVDPVAVFHTFRIGQVRAQCKQSFLNPREAHRMFSTRAGADSETKHRIQFIDSTERSEDWVGLRNALAIEEAGFTAIAVVLSTHASSMQTATDYRFEHGLHRTTPPQISRTCSKMSVRLNSGHENPSKL